MATFHHQDYHPSAFCNSSTNNESSSFGNTKVPSAFHSIESLMTSHGPTYPLDRECSMSKAPHGPYSVLPNIDNSHSYLPPIWAHSSPHPFYNSVDQSRPEPSFVNSTLFADRSNCSHGNQFTQQPTVSDLSVNPFDEQPKFHYDKKCLDVSPVTLPAGSLNDEILDVDSYSPFGSPVESESTNQTIPGPCSASSVGYSSGYQSCEGSAENSPYRPLSVEHPIQRFPQGQTDSYHPELYHHKEEPLSQCPAPNLQMIPKLNSIPSDVTPSPPSVQPVDLPLQFTPAGEPSLPPALTPGPDVPPTSSPVEETQVKQTRVKYTSAQLEILEEAFKDTPYPDWDEMEELSKKLDIAEQKIKVWFQNKRARWRKKNTAQQIQEIPGLKSLQQTSALYRFPASFPPSLPAFQPPNQNPSVSIPAHPSAPQTPQLSMSGQHYYNQPLYRPPPVPMTGMPARQQPIHSGFDFNQYSATDTSQNRPPERSSVYYQPPMMHPGTSAVSHIPQSNYDNYGHMSNSVMYPYM